ncbi:hypothetical protein N181_20315 [Sinorhizobium fredii USDA 205]|uniref:DUF2934 domain-containing protein n=1 Tax=Rhizobium fredii TaxID=380 RepID=A0A844AHP8_RHIFR|nr:DUF2934 domain-containing protein [Sinorhizobium fredii]ASY73263.1 hypothetical protein SF83666_b66140 [Sinorhizobium fredii CCBAU 83666]KSV86923.1 hypothetical protein N181_20315 [Sinorhizobium fredii USDA 205]MQX11632.1 DUF2934 domain-containing protein [Sinorhizobium fredii]GEC32264.1 hypothetical protein EFR01_24350 [Sinorhizobium fredii]GLS06909.1 hypothetical protein GCM10007864_05350 [Sinorhizobium fredii]
MRTSQEELIRKRAYELWERAGRPEGNGLQHWLQASEEIRSTRLDGASVGANTPSNAEAASTVGVKAKKVAKPTGKTAKPQKSAASGHGVTPTKKKAKRTEGA